MLDHWPILLFLAFTILAPVAVVFVYLRRLDNEIRRRRKCSGTVRRANKTRMRSARDRM